jgi:hypothetical protein
MRGTHGRGVPSESLASPARSTTQRGADGHGRARAARRSRPRESRERAAKRAARRDSRGLHIVSRDERPSPRETRFVTRATHHIARFTCPRCTRCSPGSYPHFTRTMPALYRVIPLFLARAPDGAITKVSEKSDGRYTPEGVCPRRYRAPRVCAIRLGWCGRAVGARPRCFVALSDGGQAVAA